MVLRRLRLRGRTGSRTGTGKGWPRCRVEQRLQAFQADILQAGLAHERFADDGQEALVGHGEPLREVGIERLLARQDGLFEAACHPVLEDADAPAGLQVEVIRVRQQVGRFLERHLALERGEHRGEGIGISMDGKGRWRDNVAVERLWRSLKYEEVYLKAYDSVAEARTSIGHYLAFFNTERRHQGLGRRTPDAVYFGSADQRRAA